MITMIMRKLFILVLLSLFCQTTFAQPNEVKLVVTGDGETKEEATNNALRSAVEQAFGVFVSANTEILNDELVKDEIATVSSGNIKSYVENAFFERQDGIISVTLTATVSLSQLVSYTKNHGHSTEFAGSTFGANMRLYELNREATQRALINFYRELSQILPMMYDYKLTVSDPVVNWDYDVGVIEMKVEVLSNKNTRQIGEYYFNTLAALSHSEEEVRSLCDMGNTFYGYYNYSFKKNKKVLGKEEDYRDFYFVKDVEVPFLGKVATQYLQPDYLYYPLDEVLLNNLFRMSTYGFVITDNNGNKKYFRLLDQNANSRDYEAQNNKTYFRFSEKQTGVFPAIPSRSIPRNAARPHRGDDNIPLLSHAVFMGIIGINTDYSPGEVLYRLQQSVVVPKDEIYKISAFEIHPDFINSSYSFVSELVEKGRQQEAFDIAAIIQMPQHTLSYFKEKGLSSQYYQEATKHEADIIFSSDDADKTLSQNYQDHPLAVREIDSQNGIGTKSISTMTKQTSDSNVEESKQRMTQKEDGIFGYWRGENGDMIHIPSEKTKDSEGRMVYRAFIFYKESNYCEYNNLHYEGRDEAGNLIFNMDNGHEGGTLLFNERNQTLSLPFIFHKDASISTQMEQIKAKFDAERKASQSRAAKRIAENPWVLGRWGMAGNVVAVIKKDGTAVVYGTEVIIKVSENGGNGYFEEGGEVYTIDWSNKTILWIEEPLQKLD